MLSMRFVRSELLLPANTSESRAGMVEIASFQLTTTSTVRLRLHRVLTFALFYGSSHVRPPHQVRI